MSNFVSYIYSVGDRVILPHERREGVVTACVPGNGKPGGEWYFVLFDDGGSCRYQWHEIDAAE
jgi:hypothetical protein